MARRFRTTLSSSLTVILIPDQQAKEKVVILRVKAIRTQRVKEKVRSSFCGSKIERRVQYLTNIGVYFYSGQNRWLLLP